MKEKIIESYRKSNRFGVLLGMDFRVDEKRRVIYTLQVQEEHMATPIAAHGGLIGSLIDGAAGVAAMVRAAERDCLISTVQLNITYMKPALTGDLLTAVGEVTKAGKRLIFADCLVKNQKEEIIAKASGIFNAFPAEKAFGA